MSDQPTPDPAVTLTDDEKRQVGCTCWSSGYPVHRHHSRCRVPEFERILAARLAANDEHHLAMHRAYRPEVVAEIAVHVSEEMDWDAVAAWCGGRIETTEQGDSGEYASSILIPGCRDAAGEGSWITLDHAGRFHVRTEVEGPETAARLASPPEPQAALAALVRSIEAWVRHGRAVPADVTEYDRAIVNAELLNLLEPARRALVAARPDQQPEGEAWPCTGCGRTLRKVRGLMTCDHPTCPGNLRLDPDPASAPAVPPRVDVAEDEVDDDDLAEALLRSVLAGHGWEFSDGLKDVCCDCGWTLDAYIGPEEGLAARDGEIPAVTRHRTHVARSVSAVLAAAPGADQAGTTVVDFGVRFAGEPDVDEWWDDHQHGDARICAQERLTEIAQYVTEFPDQAEHYPGPHLVQRERVVFPDHMTPWREADAEVEP